MNNLADKKVIVTGGNRGIGRAIALAFAKQGCDVVISYHSDRQAAENVVIELQNLGVRAKAIQADLLKSADRNRLAKEANDFLGNIHILVNNAGILTRKKFLELTEEEVTKVLLVNTLGPFFLSQEVGKYMIDNQKALLGQGEEPQDRCIIMISSISRKVVTPGLAHYEMSKAAVSQMAKSLAMDEDFRQYNIRVNDVAPGLVPTDINKNQWQTNSSIWQNRVAGIPLQRAGTPEEVAQVVMMVAANPWMTGTPITIDGGRTRNWLGNEIAISHDIQQSDLRLGKL